VRNLFLFIFLFSLTGNAIAGPASSKLSALAQSLIKGYAAKGGAEKTIMAAFPFNCEEKLQRQRAGFAVSEMMSHRFVADGGFVVVERGEIDKLLSEQKLQASGATDSPTAVRLGKILGADVLLLGNLHKVDGNYQVNARLVSAETGAVLVSGYEELPVAAFEDDARVYLNLLPQEQVIGIYGVLNYRYNSNDSPAFVEIAPNNQTTFNPRSFTSPMAGGGLLYRPHKNIQINAELTTSKIGTDEYITRISSYTGGLPGGSGSVYVEKQPLELTTISLMGSYVSRLGGKWHGLAGVGVQQVLAAVSQKKENPPTALFLKAGIEYKPQSRIGFGLNLKYELSPAVFRSEVSDNVLLRMNPLSFETVLALYF